MIINGWDCETLDYDLCLTYTTDYGTQARYYEYACTSCRGDETLILNNQGYWDYNTQTLIYGYGYCVKTLTVGTTCPTGFL